MWQVEVSHKSEMAGPFNRGDTIINKHFALLLYINFPQSMGPWPKIHRSSNLRCLVMT